MGEIDEINEFDTVRKEHQLLKITLKFLTETMQRKGC